MKKLLLTLAAALTFAGAMAFPKALYVKKGNEVQKYNFGVAEDLVFSNGGRTLTITGYDEAINLDNIDYITFTAPVDETAMTPNAQKDKLIQIGEKLNSIIDINELAEIVRMHDCFFIDQYDDMSYEYIYRAPCGFEVPREYYDVHNSATSMLKAFGNIGKGNSAAIRNAKAAAAELYRFADYTGIYTANATTETWEKTGEAAYFEMRFAAKTSGTYAVRVEASSDYSVWEAGDFTIQAPKTLTITLLKDQTKLGEGVVKSAFVNKSNIDVDIEFTANGYKVTNKLNVVNNLITDIVDVTVKGENICHAVSTIQGQNLVDFDVIRDDIKKANHSHDEYGDCLDDGDPYPLMAHFIRAKSDVDILGQLQLKGHLSGITKIYDVLAKDEWLEENVIKDNYYFYAQKITGHNSDFSEISVSYTDGEIVAEKANVLNSYSDLAFYYDKTDKIQGYCVWNPYTELDYESPMDVTEREQSYSWRALIDGMLFNVQRDDINSNDWYYTKYAVKEGTTGESYDDIDWENPVRVPVSEDQLLGTCVIKHFEDINDFILTFPDMTTFSFADYFDKTSFQKLIDDYNAIVDTYDTITGQK